MDLVCMSGLLAVTVVQGPFLNEVSQKQKRTNKIAFGQTLVSIEWKENINTYLKTSINERHHLFSWYLITVSKNKNSQLTSDWWKANSQQIKNILSSPENDSFISLVHDRVFWGWFKQTQSRLPIRRTKFKDRCWTIFDEMPLSW